MASRDPFYAVKDKVQNSLTKVRSDFSRFDSLSTRSADYATLLQQLRQSARFAQLPVVVVSGAGWTHADVPDADDFITKPPSVAALLQVVREYCDRALA